MSIKVKKGRVTLLQGKDLDVAKDLEGINVVCGSPPYIGKAARYDGKVTFPNEPIPWANHMAHLTNLYVLNNRATLDWVVWIANDRIKRGNFQPATSLLEAALWSRSLNLEHTCIWHKNATPNRGRNYFHNVHEKIIIVRGNRERYFNWKALATPKKYATGGRFRQRNAKGQRVLGAAYPAGELAGPTDVLYVTVGGGHMGSGVSDKHATKHYAPYPEKLLEQRLPALCRPGAIVHDPYCGSGTTAVVAARMGCAVIASDISQESLDLTASRCKALGIPFSFA